MPDWFVVHWPELAGALLVSLAGIAVWEGWLKPRRELKAIRAALAAEVGHAITYLKRHLDDEPGNPRRVPEEFHIPTTIYSALAHRLGELPPAQLGELVAVYRQFDEANRLPTVHAGLLGAVGNGIDLDEDIVLREKADRFAHSFYRYLEGIRGNAILILPLVGDPPRVGPSVDEQNARMTEAVEAYDARIRRLRRQPRRGE